MQIAVAQGASVITTVNAEQEQFVRELGATQVIDYLRERFEDEVSGVDAVLDPGGTEEAGVAEEPVATHGADRGCDHPQGEQDSQGRGHRPCPR
jgi:NADPH:quinone reductase-like Zn-dependent oxidoreductase